MPFSPHFKPTHKEIKRYYEALAAGCKSADWHLFIAGTTRVKILP